MRDRSDRARAASVIRRPLRAMGLRVLIIIACWLGPGLALAHHSSAPETNDGVSIPTLTHGQLLVVAQHFGEIRRLADQTFVDDLTFRKLNNYISLQYAACLWGLVPGSLTDEDSPFNECSHGYLSASERLLAHMRDMRGVGAAADALYERISMAMILGNAAADLCRYSDQPFNTADVEAPHWRDIPHHLPSLLAFAAAALLTFGGLVVAVTLLRGSSGRPVRPAPVSREGR